MQTVLSTPWDALSTVTASIPATKCVKDFKKALNLERANYRVSSGIPVTGLSAAGFVLASGLAIVAGTSVGADVARDAGVTIVTHTANGIPGDPINVGLVGSREDVLCAMKAAARCPAHPITLHSSVETIHSGMRSWPWFASSESPAAPVNS